MADQFYPVEKVLTVLTEGPPRIAVLNGGLEVSQTHTRPEPDEWSVNEVLAHLRSCADVWGGCIMRILTEDRPTYKALSPRTYIKKTNYPELEFQPSLDAFTTQRNELLAVLKGLSPESWARSATVKDSFGRVFDNTILYYGDRMARHEREHVRQIENIVDTLRK